MIAIVVVLLAMVVFVGINAADLRTRNRFLARERDEKEAYIRRLERIINSKERS